MKEIIKEQLNKMLNEDKDKLLEQYMNSFDIEKLEKMPAKILNVDIIRNKTSFFEYVIKLEIEIDEKYAKDNDNAEELYKKCRNDLYEIIPMCTGQGHNEDNDASSNFYTGFNLVTEINFSFDFPPEKYEKYRINKLIKEKTNEIKDNENRIEDLKNEINGLNNE